MQILDHGSVELIDSMASDQSVLRAMLISTGRDESEDWITQPVQGLDTESSVLKNRGRINYLMKNKHGTPFEHNCFIFRVTAPIFVFREWHRHRIGWSYNEQSGRYMELGDKWYIPDKVRTRVGKPGHYKYEIMEESVHTVQFRDWLNQACSNDYFLYKGFLEKGVAPEQARMFLHVNHFVSCYCTCNARSLMKFLELRAHENAQWEIQQYANALESYFSESMPVTHEAFNNNGRIAP